MNDIDDTEPSKFDEDCSVLSVSHQHLQDDFSRSSTPPPSLGGVHEVKTNNFRPPIVFKRLVLSYLECRVPLLPHPDNIISS